MSKAAKIRTKPHSALSYITTDAELQAYVDGHVAAERERCAMVTEGFATKFNAEADAAFFATFVRREVRLLGSLLSGLAAAIRKGEA